MNLIGLTGKSGSGKSYFANRLQEKFENSSVINFDNIFSDIMNNEEISSKIYDMYGDKVVKNGRVDLDVILSNKEMFSSIYEMIIVDLEERVRQEIIQSEAERKRKCNNGLVGITKI